MLSVGFQLLCGVISTSVVRTCESAFEKCFRGTSDMLL